ncbi:L-asparaginase isoform X2 [Aphis craccivora]|uniref:L-asparaginase isoform X2 n=1 Tax=Aphis craccivora TaxID=307492 RepID=A0A6G0YZH5_APHCR|nr:L-asparaginase isoform X2 [Aphis craccivora]
MRSCNTESEICKLYRIGLKQYYKQAYELYDGFVVLHGTDTLAYTASALSFMFENLGKTIIITGAQFCFTGFKCSCGTCFFTDE